MAEFNIDFVSDLEHEHLMAEISFNGQRLCVLDKEGGNDQIQIEFVSDLYVLPENVRMKFSLAEFLKTVETAKSDLEKCA
jgi:cupin superfamily acireductone dioxygenase involved in methionine salvage